MEKEKYSEPTSSKPEDEEFSPLGLSLLEEFSSWDECLYTAFSWVCFDFLGNLRGHLFKPLLWQQQRVGATLLTCSSCLHWAIMAGLLSTLRPKWPNLTPSIWKGRAGCRLSGAWGALGRPFHGRFKAGWKPLADDVVFLFLGYALFLLAYIWGRARYIPTSYFPWWWRRLPNIRLHSGSQHEVFFSSSGVARRQCCWWQFHSQTWQCQWQYHDLPLVNLGMVYVTNVLWPISWKGFPG